MSKKLNIDKTELLKYIFLIIITIALEIIFFRSLLDFNKIIGDSGDARLNSLIMEHWYNVFRGREVIKDLLIFYPSKGTLGYTDTLFLLAVPYSMLRFIGIQWLTSYQIILIGTHIFGTFCLLFLLLKIFKTSFFSSIIGLIISNFSNSYYLKVGHTQLFCVSLVPFLFILIYYFYENFTTNSNRWRRVYGVLAIVYFSLIITTSYYIGFFTAFFLVITHIIFVIYKLKNKKTPIQQLLNVVKLYKSEIVMYCIVGFISLLPFFWIYLPVLNVTGARSWSSVAFYLPKWFNFFDTSQNNLLWSFPFTSEAGGEVSTGYPVITFILLIITAFFSIKKFIENNKKNNEKKDLYIMSFSITIVIVSLVILKFDNGYSLWWFMHKFVPGASSLRAIGRYNFYLSLPLGIVVAYFLSNSEQYKFRNVIYLLLCAVIFLEHQNSSVNARWTKSETYMYIDKVSPPPADCESFIIVNDVLNVPFRVQLNAWCIANKYNINTVNGYSGQFPIGWFEIFWDMEQNKNYSDAIKWTTKNNLQNVYLYNVMDDNWMRCTEDTLIAMEGCNSANSPDLLKAEYKLEMLETISGNKLAFSFKVRNTGDAIWRKPSNKGTVNLGIRWYNSANKEIVELCRRFNLDDNLDKDGLFIFYGKIDIPEIPGDYTINFGLVSEGVTWFEDIGTDPVIVNYTIE